MLMEVIDAASSCVISFEAGFYPSQRLLCEGFSLRIEVLKTTIRENGCQNHLADQQLYQLFEKVDAHSAAIFHQQRCRCGGKLHRADYDRKPRGGPQWDQRHSFCCDREGCRRRHTPPSVRFLGRKVYAGFVVVLLAAMNHGIKPERLGLLRQTIQIDRRTLERWRQWWLNTFVRSAFWKEARARFTPLLCERTLPQSLCVAFEVERRDRLLDLMRFLAPITTPTAWKELAM